MSSTDAPAEVRETVYAAIELSKKTWMLGIAHPDRDRPSIHRVCGGNIMELVSRLLLAARNNRRILVCYEAGYDAFWLARALVKIGIECRVLDPASIQVNRPASRVKTDRIDVLALLRALIATDRGERHVMDNYATHKTPLIRNWLARRPRWHVHLTPTSSSWLNQIERFFALLTERQIRRGVHRSIDALHTAIDDFIAGHNADPKPFRWTKSADDILASIEHFCLYDAPPKRNPPLRTSGSGH